MELKGTPMKPLMEWVQELRTQGQKERYASAMIRETMLDHIPCVVYLNKRGMTVRGHLTRYMYVVNPLPHDDFFVDAEVEGRVIPCLVHAEHLREVEGIIIPPHPIDD